MKFEVVTVADTKILFLWNLMDEKSYSRFLKNIGTCTELQGMAPTGEFFAVLNSISVCLLFCSLGSSCPIRFLNCLVM